MKVLVAYYSHTGNNRYLAERIAKDVKGTLYEIQPRIKSFWWLLVSSLLGIGFGIRNNIKKVEQYDNVVLCGPIWMGQFITPLRGFLKKNRKAIHKLHFATCCASGEAEKDSKFGYNTVLGKIKNLMEEKLISAEAFSIELVTPKESIGKSDEILNIRLSDNNFQGRILEKYTKFVQNIQ